MTKIACWAAMAMVVAATAFAQAGTPKGWQKAGSAPDAYDVGVQKGGGPGGRNAAFLRSREPVEKGGFAILVQTVEASPFAGKRVRFSGEVKTDGVRRVAALWVRMDGSPQGKAAGLKTLAFARSRGVEGSSEWTRCDVVMDVPPPARQISYGLSVDGDGGAMLSGARFEAVGTDVPLTAPPTPPRPLPRPANLDFEE